MRKLSTLAQNESEIHFERLVFVGRMGGLVETSIGWRMGERFTVFAEISAEISGCKNCKEAIFALAGQALLRKNRVLEAAKPPLRIDVGGAMPLQTTPGFMKFYIFRGFAKEAAENGQGAAFVNSWDCSNLLHSANLTAPSKLSIIILTKIWAAFI